MGLGDYHRCQQRTSRGLHGAPCPAAPWSPAAAAAREERNRMRMECALARLRAELLELRFQNHQLASTLLDLNTKMRQLKQQHELDGASRPGSPEDKAMSPSRSE
uniref:Alanine and arginine-rich domain-containing protein n=1 Tax=Jaculus jaculus TaxID=51337 RepID=A0A8C5K2J5_JACJA